MAPLAVQPGVCGEANSLRRGPSGLMFNWLPPHLGTLAPAALSWARCEAGSRQSAHHLPREEGASVLTTCPGRKDLVRAGATASLPRAQTGRGNGRWHSALGIPTGEHQAHLWAQRGCSPAAACGFATDALQVPPHLRLARLRPYCKRKTSCLMPFEHFPFGGAVGKPRARVQGPDRQPRP